MTTPIINPASLTEEQREAIKALYGPEYEYFLYYTKAIKGATTANRKFYIGQREIILGRIRLYYKFFGKDFFEKGENHE